jgi:hypothetical protein
MGRFGWRAAASIALIVGTATSTAACGPHASRVKSLSAPTSVQARVWGEKAGTALSVMRGFLDSMGSAVTVGPATKEKFMAMCSTAVAHLPELEAAVGPTGSAPDLSNQMHDALAGFEQYIRSCAAGDDHGADIGLDRYENASQAVYRIVDQMDRTP